MMLSSFKTFRRTIAPALIAGVTVLSLAGAGFGASDLNGHWASTQMNAWIGQGIIKGYPDGTVKPDASVTRAEFMAMVNKAYRLSGSSGKAFKDVSSKSWYSSVIDTAATAGYIGGYPDGTMRPDARISRNEAAVIIMKVSGLSGNSDASAVFSDSGKIPSWAQAAVGAAYRKGAMSGYPDGTFGGERSISRAEAVISLSRTVSAAVTPTVPTAPTVPVTTDKTYSDPGTYGSGSTQTIKGNATIKVSGVTLNNLVIEGDLIIAKEVSSGDATLKNVTVKGNTYIYGGGPNSVHFINVSAGKVNVSRESGTVRLVLSGSSVIDKVIAKSDLKLEETSLSRSGASYLSIESGYTSGVDVELIGAGLDEVDMSASGSTLSSDSRTTVTRLTVSARDTMVTLESGSTVSRLIADAAVKVRGRGTVTRADVNVSDVTFETTPKETNVKSGVTAPSTSNPYIQSFSPSDGSTGASLSTDIVITYSETVRLISDTALSSSNVDNLITLRSGSSSGTNVSFDATVRTSSGKTIVTIDPRDALSASTRYYVAIEDVEDSDNLRVTGSRSASFTTVGNTAPRIESFSPASGSTTAAVSSDIVLTFSETVRRASGNATLSDSNVGSLITLKKTNSGGASVPFTATVRVSGGKTVITVNPAEDLANGQLYFVSISDIEDLDDMSLTGNAYATFTTAPLADAAPTIESITPGNDSANATVDTNIVFSYSEIMRALNDTSLENNTVDALVVFKTPNSSGTTVNFDAKVSTVNGKTVITIDPSDNLLNNTTYYVSVAGVEDSANQTVSGNATFTTVRAAANPLTGLSVEGVSGAVALNSPFAGGTFAYTATVANACESVKFTPVTAEGNQAEVAMGSVVKNDGACALAVGSNNVTVTVKKTGCTDLVYTFTITRENPPAPTDSTAPSYQSFSVGSANQSIALTFNEAILDNTGSETALKGAVTLSVDGSSFTPLADGDSVSISGSVLTINLSTAITGSANAITIAANALKDAAGNACGAVSVSSITAS